MIIREIKAKSLLRKYKRIDSWFISRYGMNLYRGCAHNCSYCDGRAEGYYVSGEFGKKIEVKINAPELLKKELDPTRKRVPLKKGLILPGGGVGDSYQPIEAKYELTKEILKIINQFDFGIHILTKSSLVERDIDIISEINQKSRAILSFSFSSTNEKISKIFEPGASSPTARLKTISKFKSNGIPCGMLLMPVIPFFTDTAEMMERSIRDAKNAGVDFIIFGGMTLKEGRQKEHFFGLIKKLNPDLIKSYQKIYAGGKYGSPAHSYVQKINSLFFEICSRHKIPPRIPAGIFSNFIDQNDLVVVILDQMDYLLKVRGQRSSYGFAAYSLSQLKEPIENLKDEFTSLSGIGVVTKKLIEEILQSGTCSYYEKLLVS